MMKTNTELLAEFHKRFTALDWSEKRQLVDIVGLDLLPDIEKFLTTALNQRTEDIVGMIDEVAYIYRTSSSCRNALADLTNKIKALYGVEK